MIKFRITEEIIEIKYAVQRIESQLIRTSIDLIEPDSLSMLKEVKQSIDLIIRTKEKAGLH